MNTDGFQWLPRAGCWVLEVDGREAARLELINGRWHRPLGTIGLVPKNFDKIHTALTQTETLARVHFKKAGRIAHERS